jgi:hypothetical protein
MLIGIALLDKSSVINIDIYIVHTALYISRKKYHGKKDESYNKAD